MRVQLAEKGLDRQAGRVGITPALRREPLEGR
jgi:hypothetical protein